MSDEQRHVQPSPPNGGQQVHYHYDSRPPKLQTAPGATASMVCGIIGIVVPYAGLILAIIALVLGAKAKKALSQEPQKYGGGGQATTGIVLGVIVVAWQAIWILLCAGMAGIGAVAGS